MEDTRSVSAGRSYTLDVKVGGRPYRLMTSGLSPFMGLLYTGRVTGGEFCGYVTNLDTEPQVHKFQHWRIPADDLDELGSESAAFYGHVTGTRQCVDV